MAEATGRESSPTDGRQPESAAEIAASRLADFAVAHGAPFAGGGNRPIRLDDPDALWFVASGSVDVFVAREEDGGALVEFKHLLRATRGRLLFQADEGPNVLVAKGLPDSELRRLPRAALLTADEGGALVDQVDAWVAGISAAVALDVTHRQPTDCFLAAGAVADLKPGEVVSTKGGVVWMSSRDVGLAFLGTEESDRTGSGFVPVAPGSWVSVSGRTRQRGASSRELHREGRLLAALAEFHRLSLGAHDLNRRLLLADAVNLRAAQTRHRRESEDAARRSLFDAVDARGADNVDELVAVTGDARQLRCSRTENPTLFDCVRGGLGQFAVITEARIRLRRTLPDVRTFFLAYDDIEALMQDQRQVISDDRFEYIASTCFPRAAGLERLFARQSQFAERRYVMSLTREFDRELDAGGALAGLHGGRLLGMEDGSARDVPFGLDRSGPGNRDDRRLAHPWIEGILPWRTAGRCVEEVLAELPSALPADTAVLLWSARRDRFGSPMLALPAGELLMGFAILPAVKPAALARLLPALEAAGRRLTTMGGKRYLSGWIDYDHEQWRAHFGELWPRVVEWKAAFDPHGILDPGFIRYRPAQPA